MGNSAPQAINISSPVTNNNSDINAPVISPVINLPEFKINPTFTSSVNVDTVDENLGMTQRSILKLLMAGLASGSAAVVMNESPMYYGSMGLLIAGGKKYATPIVGSYGGIAVLGGGTAVSAVMGKDVVSSAIILGTGSLVGDLVV